MTDSSREETVFLAALAQLPDQRAGYLEEVCAGDPRLRASVEALLAAHERAPAFLDAAVVSSVAPLPEERTGDEIGRYKLLQKIGEGGYGVVYMAEQTEPVRRRVALKVIKLGMDTKAVIARFEAERQALAMMDHPNIAKVFDAGATQMGRPYFVMELVCGLPITRFCDENQLSTADRIRLFTQVCHAIQHAHQKGVIHRDIKPSNVIVTLHDGVPVPKVIDFGIAKATQGRLTDHTVFTGVDQFVGTPTYTSPEQANLGELDVDTRSDIYSLGVLLYELLTGRTPFDAKELAQAGIEEIRRRIREVEPPRPSTRLSTLSGDVLDTAARQRQTNPPRLITMIRGDLDWIVMCCLEKDRRRRYESASELALDLQRHLGDEPVAARPPSTAYWLRKTVQRHKLAVAAGASIALALVAGLSVATWAFLKEKSARERAVAAERTALSESKKSEEVAKFLQAMLQSVGPSVALGRDTALLREVVDQTAARLDQDLRDQPVVEAELRDTLGGLYYELGEFEKAKAMHERALELRRKALGPEHSAVAKSMVGLAQVKSVLGDYVTAETMLRDALALQRKLLGGENSEVAETTSILATILYLKRNAAAAEAEQRAALLVQRRLGEVHSSIFARILADLALSSKDNGRLISALEMARESANLLRKLKGSDHPELARSLYVLGAILLATGDSAEAVKNALTALHIQKRSYGHDHPVVADTLYLVAAGLYASNDYRGAHRAIKEGLSIQLNVFGSAHLQVARFLRLMAISLYTRFDRAGAAEALEQALSIQRKVLGPEHLEIGESLTEQAYVLALMGERERAETVGTEGLDMRRRFNDPKLDEALARIAALRSYHGKWQECLALAGERASLLERLLGPDHTRAIAALSFVAWAYYNAGDLDRALSLSENAVTRLTAALGLTHITTLKAKLLLGQIYTATGQSEKAISCLEKTLQLLEQAFGAAHYDSSLCAYHLGKAYRKANRVADMEALFARYVDSVANHEDSRYLGAGGALTGLGEALVLQGRFREAEKSLRRAVEIMGKESHRWLCYNVRSIYGAALAGQGRFTEAEAVLLDAYHNLTRLQGDIPWPLRYRVTESLERICALYSTWGDGAKFEKWAFTLEQFKRDNASSVADRRGR